MGNGASNTTRFFERSNLRRQERLANRSGLNLGMPKFSFRMDLFKDRINASSFSVPRRLLKWAPLAAFPVALYWIEQQEQVQMDKLQRVTEDLSRREAEYVNQVFRHWKAEAKLDKLQAIAEEQRELERQLMASKESKLVWVRRQQRKAGSGSQLGDK